MARNKRTKIQRKRSGTHHLDAEAFLSSSPLRPVGFSSPLQNPPKTLASVRLRRTDGLLGAIGRRRRRRDDDLQPPRLDRCRDRSRRRHRPRGGGAAPQAVAAGQVQRAARRWSLLRPLRALPSAAAAASRRAPPALGPNLRRQ
jgi:hypothetical protein